MIKEGLLGIRKIDSPSPGISSWQTMTQPLLLHYAVSDRQISSTERSICSWTMEDIGLNS